MFGLEGILVKRVMCIGIRRCRFGTKGHVQRGFQYRGVFGKEGFLVKRGSVLEVFHCIWKKGLIQTL